MRRTCSSHDQMLSSPSRSPSPSAAHPERARRTRRRPPLGLLLLDRREVAIDPRRRTEHPTILIRARNLEEERGAPVERVRLEVPGG